MQIGFTGTQKGMTVDQQVAVASLLDVLCKDGGHVHHGDCIGADTQFHSMAVKRGLRVEIHPPTNPAKRSYCKADIRWPAYDYLVRNKHIVDCSQVLIAAPRSDETLRSGTWSTVRYARSKERMIYLVQPDGKIV